jgi:hypothetical protein
VPESIRVALVNDYEIVLEGLRGLLRPHDPEIRVVETKTLGERTGSPSRIDTARTGGRIRQPSLPKAVLDAFGSFLGLGFGLIGLAFRLQRPVSSRPAPRFLRLAFRVLSSVACLVPDLTHHDSSQFAR